MRIQRVMASTMIAVALTVGTALAQGNIYQATLQEPNPATAEVSTDELKLILQTGSAMVFDARPFMEFAVSHIPGAVNVAPKPGLPASQYTSDVAEVGRLLELLWLDLREICTGIGDFGRRSRPVDSANRRNVRRINKMCVMGY